jgi:hypothetical protein
MGWFVYDRPHNRLGNARSIMMLSKSATLANPDAISWNLR